MEGFKRFCLIVFSLVGLAALCALALPWIGPWTELFTSFLSIQWYLFVLELCLLLLALGFLGLFIRGCTMRRHHDVEVLSGEGAKVTIARSAIASQATYLAEQDGTCVVTKVVVKVRRKDEVDVRVSVQPYQSVNVQVEAQKLHERLREGLTRLCGPALRNITLRFVEPRSTGDIGPGSAVDAAGAASSSAVAYVPSPVHRANREIRHEVGAAPTPAPDFGLEATGSQPKVVIEPSRAEGFEDFGERGV